MPISPKLAPTDTPESSDDFRPPPTGYPRTALSAHSLTLAHTKYVRAFTVPLLYYPGFHRTAVLCLTEPHISLTIHRTQPPPPPPQLWYIDYTTRFTFYLKHPCGSLKTAATTELPPTGSSVSLHTYKNVPRRTSPRQRMQTTSYDVA